MGAVWPLVLLIFAPAFGKTERCEIPLRTRVVNGSLQVQDEIGRRIVENGTFWREEGFWWTCPCLKANCVRICDQSMLEGLKQFRNLSAISIDVWRGEQTSAVILSEHFHIISEAACENCAIFLEKDDFRILANGSLFLPNNLSVFRDQIVSVSNSCLIPLQENKIGALVCLPPIVQCVEENGKFKFYPIFFILSIFFLLLTLAALFLTSDLSTLHLHSVVCQSGSLLMAYVGLTLNYLVHDHGQLKLCQITGYMTYFFSMASFFWLNVMCVDIYITFSGFLRRTSERTCQKLCLFAWSVPLFLTTTTAILDCVAEDQWFSPGIGQYSCWFANKKSEFLLFHGPVLFLLLINCHLFCVTALKLRRERRDAVRALHDEDTRVFGRFGQRLRLYAKLFLLMGCTWFLEIISWAVGGPPEVWYLPDAINGLRGVFIFWFCVWSNANTRVLLRDRFDSILDKVKNRFLM